MSTSKDPKPKAPGRAKKRSIDDEVQLPEIIFTKEEQIRNALLFVAIAGTSVVVLHGTQYLLGWDPLAVGFINGHLVSIDSWSLVHVITFACISLTYPNQLALFSMYGIIWEVLEFILAGGSNFWEERGVNSLWDLWFNLAGYRLGEWILLFILKRRWRAEERKRRAEEKKELASGGRETEKTEAAGAVKAKAQEQKATPSLQAKKGQ